jgi:hypothetical protein
MGREDEEEESIIPGLIFILYTKEWVMGREQISSLITMIRWCDNSKN